MLTLGASVGIGLVLFLVFRVSCFSYLGIALAFQLLLNGIASALGGAVSAVG